MSNQVYINIYTSYLEKELKFSDLPTGAHILGIKIEDDLLKHQIRCNVKNVEETESIIQETLEEYRKEGWLKRYRISI